MNLKPKKTKFTKHHKGRISYIPSNTYSFAYGQFSLVAKEPGRIKSVHIAAAELAIKRKLKNDKGNSKLYLRIFPHLPVTKKPAEVRMGKGKGNIDYWMTRVRIGTILFDIQSSNPSLVKIALKIAASKLPIKTTIVEHKSS